MIIAPRPPEMRLQPGEALRAKVGARLDAEPRHPGRGHRTDAMEALDREGGDEGEPLARRDDAEAVRLVLVAGELGEAFVVGNHGRGGEARSEERRGGKESAGT